MVLGCDASSSSSSAPDPTPLRAPTHPVYSIRGRLDRPELLSYQLDTTAIPDPIPEPIWRRAIQTALSAWSAASAITFKETTAPSAADLTFSWHAGPRPECLAFTDWEGSFAHTGPVARPGFIHFDSATTWSEDGEEGRGLLQTALHEIGHFLGLDHVDDETSVMYPGYDRRRRRLGPSDRAGIATLYGGGDDQAGDLAFTFVGSDNAPVAYLSAPRLRAAAPPGEVDWTVLDLDGDGKAELLTWPRSNTGPPVMTSWHFGPGCKLEETRGPFISAVDPRRPSCFATHATGEAVAVQLYKDGRYRAYLFDDRGLPAKPWPDGAAMKLDNGLADEDGDGRFDLVTPSRPRRELGDFDGDGRPERLHRCRTGDD